MTTPVVTVTPWTSIQEAAALLHHHNIGCLVVVVDHDLLGIITDRDIVKRAIAETPADEGYTIPVRQCMTRDAFTCRDDQDVAQASVVMADHQIRRLPVVDRDGSLVGMLTLGDIAENVSEQLAGEVLGEICERR